MVLSQPKQSLPSWLRQFFNKHVVWSESVERVAAEEQAEHSILSKFESYYQPVQYLFEWWKSWTTIAPCYWLNPLKS